MLRRNDNADAKRLKDFSETIGNLPRQPFLNLEPPGKAIDQSSELRNTDDLVGGNVADCRRAIERQEVMLTVMDHEAIRNKIMMTRNIHTEHVFTANWAHANHFMVHPLPAPSLFPNRPLASTLITSHLTTSGTLVKVKKRLPSPTIDFEMPGGISFAQRVHGTIRVPHMKSSMLGRT